MSKVPPITIWPDRLLLMILVLTMLVFFCELNGFYLFHKGWLTLLVVFAATGTLPALLGWSLAASIFKRPFQFSLRSLLLLMLVVAMAFSLLAKEIKNAEEQRLAFDAIKGFGDLAYDWQSGPDGRRIRDAQPPAPKWLCDLFGVNFFGEITAASIRPGVIASEAGMETLERLSRVEHLDLVGGRITDAGLRHVQACARLKTLRLLGVQATDRGMEYVSGLKNLETLFLVGSHVTDRGFERFSGLLHLKRLYLLENRLTSGCLATVSQLPCLEELYIGGLAFDDSAVSRLVYLRRLKVLMLLHTKVTDDGLNEIKRALPGCKVAAEKLIETF
jgi:hypothetical protein